MPPLPKPVPEATIANAGTPYKSKQNADFALKRKKGISADTHEVVERAGYGWFIVPKGSAVPPAAPPPLTPVPEHQAEPVPPTPAVAPPVPPESVAAPADLPVDIPPREETVPPLAPAPLPDYAQGIPEGPQVPLVRPTAQDAEHLIVQAQETMRELAQLHRVRARDPQDVYDTAVRMRERLAQYERELTPAQDDLRTQLANVDRNYANFLQGIDPHESVEAQAEHLTARMSEMTRSPQKTEAIRPLAEAMFLRAKTLLEEGLNPKVYDKLANATRVLRARVRPSAPPAPPVPPVPVAPEPPALPEPIAAPPPALPAPRRAARLGQTAMERLVDAAETLLAHTPPPPVADLRALLEQVRTAQQQLPQARVAALAKETLRDALADVAQRLNLAVVRRADEEPSAPPEPAASPSPEPPGPTAPPTPTAQVQPVTPDVAFKRLTASLLLSIRRGTPPKTIRDLQALADEAYGGTRAGGEYDTRDLYDAMEVALNQEVQRLGLSKAIDPTVDLEQAQNEAAVLHTLSTEMPTQTVRTAEQDALQQFSTPLDYAYAAAWVANLQPTDVVLEPSAGTGTLAGMARLVVGGKVHVNEIAERRLMALQQQGYRHVYAKDALFLHALLHNQLSPAPTVVIMNPPFSSAAAQGRHEPLAGAHHVEQALKLLPPGGRLVAIVGQGMKPYDPAALPGRRGEPTGQQFRDWWKVIADKHTIRANIGVSGDVYSKQGTHFATRLLVIDTGTPTAPGSTLTGDVETIPELLATLEEVRHVRTPALPETTGATPASTGGGDAQLQPSSPRPTDAVEPPRGEERPVSAPHRPPEPGPGEHGGLERPGGGGVPPAPPPGRSPSGGQPQRQRPAGGDTRPGRPTPPERTPRPPEPAPGRLPTPEPPGGRVPEGLAPGTPPLAPQFKDGDFVLWVDREMGRHYGYVRPSATDLGSHRVDEVTIAPDGTLIENGKQRQVLIRQLIKTERPKLQDPPAPRPPPPAPPEAPQSEPDSATPEANAVDLTEAIFTPYVPQQVQIPGAKPHPGPLVESAAMASVPSPLVTYTPQLPPEVISEGRLSLPQLEAVIYAGQAHAQMLPGGERIGPALPVEQIQLQDAQGKWGPWRPPDTGLTTGLDIGTPARASDKREGTLQEVDFTRSNQILVKIRYEGEERKGYFIGDSTGVGKGREIAGIVLDNWRQGRTKALWITKNGDLFGQAQRDWVAVSSREPTDIFSLSKPATSIGDAIRRAEGILFTSYDTLKSAAKGEPTSTRLKQIVEWLGPDFDGVIAFDESHAQGNNMQDPGAGRYARKPSERALAGQALRDALPNARVVYLSATGATEVSNMGYLDRLGLWGPGTPFATKLDFISQVSAGGVAAMELAARDMKAMGVYLSRSLSYHGVGV